MFEIHKLDVDFNQSLNHIHDSVFSLYTPVSSQITKLFPQFLAAMIIVLLAQFAAVVIMFIFESSVRYYMQDGMSHSLLFYGKVIPG